VVQGRKPLRLQIHARIVSRILILLAELISVRLALEVTVNRGNLLAFQPHREITGMELLTLDVRLEPFLLLVQVRWTLVSNVVKDFTVKRARVIAHLVRLDFLPYLVKRRVVFAQLVNSVDLRLSSVLTAKVVSSTTLPSKRLA